MKIYRKNYSVHNDSIPFYIEMSFINKTKEDPSIYTMDWYIGVIALGLPKVPPEKMDIFQLQDQDHMIIHS